MSKGTTLLKKYLNVAAPDSGASLNERRTAALNAVELILKEELVINEKDAVPRKVRDETPAWDPPRTQYDQYGNFYYDDDPTVTYSPFRKVYHDASAAPPPFQKVTEPSYHTGTSAMLAACRKCGGMIPSGSRVMRRLIYGCVEYVHVLCWEQANAQR